jgi:hypothetical protein
MDRTLDAELDAARTAARRRRTLRDRLLDAEDSAAPVVVWISDGSALHGVIEGVGTDHVDIAGPSGRWTVALGHLATLQTFD